MKAGHLNTQSKNKWILQSVKQYKQWFYKNIITNLPNGDNSD